MLGKVYDMVQELFREISIVLIEMKCVSLPGVPMDMGFGELFRIAFKIF